MQHCPVIDRTGRMIVTVEQRESAMTTEHQNEIRELAGNEIDAIAGGGYVHLHPTGFGVRTDAIIAFKAANQLSLYQVPTLP
jgi:hypothetical protein